MARTLRNLTVSQLKDMGAPPEAVAAAMERDRLRDLLLMQRLGGG